MAKTELARWLNVVSDEALQSLAGHAVFTRGQAHARDGSVQEPEMSPLRDQEAIALEASVRGSHRFQVRVALDQRDGLHCECDCPHAAEGFFCKHQVALALVLRSVLSGEATDGDKPVSTAPATQRAQTLARKAADLQAFLVAQPADDPKALQTAMTELLRDRRDFLDWRESVQYARRAEMVLDWLRPWLVRDPLACLDLCDHTLRRLYKVMQHADDSGGRHRRSVGAVMDLCADAVQAAQPPASWLARWFDLMAADPFGLWRETEVLTRAGPASQAACAQQAFTTWQHWVKTHPMPSPSPGRRGAASEPIDRERSRLRERYLRSLRLRDDPRALLDAMTASADSVHEWVAVVELCEAQGWFRDAMQWAPHVHKLFPDGDRIEDALLRAYERDGWDDEALLIRRRQLQQQPTEDRYLACLAAAERAGQDRAAYRQELMDWMAERELQTVFLPPERVGFPKRTSVERVVSVRASWCLAEGRWQDALNLVQPPNVCEPRTLYHLAHALPSVEQERAVWLLQRVFDAHMTQSKSPYSKELALVREIAARMAPAQASAWVNGLRQTYKARRTFLAGLPQA